jgi:hypothetical protein
MAPAIEKIDLPFEGMTRAGLAQTVESALSHADATKA